MRMFEVQGIEILAQRDKLFAFVSEPGMLPRWVHAFQSVGSGRARLETPAGTVDLALRTEGSAAAGAIDWRMEVPDGSVGLAQSRIAETTRGTCIYSFVLHAPPIALEQIEGALAQQSVTLRGELSGLKALMEA